MFRFTKLIEIFDKQKTIFHHIDELNILLRDTLPQHLLCSSHIGAIDYNKNIVVLFVDSPEVLHLIKFHSDNILDHFNKNHYNFDSILIKVSQNSNNQNYEHKNNLINL